MPLDPCIAFWHATLASDLSRVCDLLHLLARGGAGSFAQSAASGMGLSTIRLWADWVITVTYLEVTGGRIAGHLAAALHSAAGTMAGGCHGTGHFHAGVAISAEM
jgi:hypothetical protein